jgi:sugar O-acyltransferase (sialic acid O-acetyltransferase NeuD family)
MQQRSDIVVYGAGGMGQEVADLILALDGDDWDLLGFIDDDPGLDGKEILGLPVLGGRDWLADRSVAVVVAVGSPAARRRASCAVKSIGVEEAPALVHPTAYVGRGCTVGEGTIVAAQAALTADVVVGRRAIVNTGATVSHNSRLGDFSTVAPGAHLAGNVHVGQGAEIGIGASVLQGRTIGEWSVVGGGAVVVDDVDPNTTVVGCPARVVKTRPEGWYR